VSTTIPLPPPEAGTEYKAPATFLRWVLVTFVLVAALNIGVSLRFGAIKGDLTRVGGFAERDYQPGAPQAEARIAPNTVALADADVVVLGDSFSNKLLWQGELEALTGQRTLTFQYGQVGCISNWLRWLHGQPLKPGAQVIIESSERSFIARFNQMAECPKITPVPVHRHLETGGKSWFDSGLSLDIVYQGRVLMNSMRLRTQEFYRAGETVNVALKREDRFTDHRPDRLLYHIDDEGKNAWTPAQMANALTGLKAEQAAFAASGQKFSMLVMPDKSSVYREDIVAPRIRPSSATRELQAAGLFGMDTLACFRALATTMPDFYLPDDTHVGPDGFRRVAASLAQGQQCVLPAAPAGAASASASAGLN
jgi:hypothetical protein